MEYKKYRWFYTRSNKLVIGGKSAEQNDELLNKLKLEKKNYVVMHTVTPGSPFTILLDNKKPSKSDLQEMAIFTISFSQLWKQKKHSGKVHIFTLKQVNKIPGVKTGTWHVTGKIQELTAPLRLTLIKQLGILRAVPIITVPDKNIELTISPGNLDKSSALIKVQALYSEIITQDELVQALPSGGIKLS